MAQAILAEWEGCEYDHEPKSADWYWALGIIAVTAAIAAVLFANYLFAILIIVAAGALALHAAKEPPIHRFRLVDHGLLIGDNLHAFNRMASFSFLEDVEGRLPPLLSIKTHNWHAPHLVIPLEGADADLVYAHFLRNVNEEAHHHTLLDVVAAWLGF